jgi:hypothetical protein
MKNFRRKAALSLACVALGSAIACAGAPPPEPKAKPPAAYEGLLKERKGLLEKFASIDDTLREKCEFAEGDCLIHTRDERFEMLSLHAFPECDTKSGDDKMFCEEERGVEEGLGDRMVTYYKHHNSCLDELMQCTARLVDEAKEAARRQLAAQRKQHIESLGKSEALHVDALATAESVNYMRSTLPPKEEGACTDMSETAQCLATVKAEDAELDAELMKPDGEYDEERAAQLYQAARSTEVTCPEAELGCLYARAQKYGATKETQRVFKRNVEILKQRERLGLRAGKQAAADCESAAVAKHQGDIISAYKTYVRQPVLFFRNKLHRVFEKMHRSQVSCLRDGAKSAQSTKSDGPELHATR